MKKIFILFFLYCFRLPVAYCQSTYWQQKVNYTIVVTLNDVEKTLDGNVAIKYFNNSPDTLQYIWINLWANAYKNDRTAFSDQSIENGRTDFYFSDDDKRGYINRLNFKVDGNIATVEEHPQYQDIIKLILPKPIPPHDSATIETPFHVKVPYNFSGNGHVYRSFEITQWYPSVAVYDMKGWHINTYLNKDDKYNEFGDYEVSITLPKNYIVAATGALQTTTEQDFLKEKYNKYSFRPKGLKYNPKNLKKIIQQKLIPPHSSKENKTISFKQNNTQEFVWFADKRFNITHDTLQLKSGKVINLYVYLLPSVNANWIQSISLIKKTILTRSKWLGEYPYSIASIVETPSSFDNNTKYPTLTSISQDANKNELATLIEKGIGETWNYGALSSNDNDHLWMSEGINDFYTNRYNKINNVSHCSKNRQNFDSLILQTVIQQKKDQPIETSTDKFSQANYHLIADVKTSEWMTKLERNLGDTIFDNCMREYYQRWKFKHPYPGDLKKTIEDVSGKNVDNLFALLNKKGSINVKTKKKFHLLLAPALGYNNYDNIMIGAAISNYSLPHPKFQFIVTPLYASGSKQLNGIGKIQYTWYPNKYFEKIEAGINGERFSSKESLDTNGYKIFENFYKIVPSLKFYFNHPIKSPIVSWLDFRFYFIGEKSFNNFKDVQDSTGSDIFYPVSSGNTTRYINQISFNLDNRRVLYPYSYQLQLQQGAGFYRLNVTGNYFFNYVKGGGLAVRLFAAKFGYIGAKDPYTYQYQPKLAAGNGTDDYTYSDYFMGRSASYSNPDKPISNQGLATQQLLIQNTGGLKFRFDLNPALQGQSENWVTALNFVSTIPNFLLPVKNPFRIFFDIGTYSEAWGVNPPTNRFLYTGGLQLSLFKNVLNIYAPIVYSTDFNSVLKSDPQQNTFLKRISFSIDVQNIKLKKIVPVPYQTLVD